MILHVYDWDFMPVGLIEEYETCSWIRRFRSRGECTMSVPYSAEALEVLQVENWMIQENGDEAMVITAVTLSKDQTGADTINVTAYGLFQLLNRRVCDKEYEDVEMNAQGIIYELIEKNITKATDKSRILPYVKLNRRETYKELESSEFSLEKYQRLGDAIEEQLSSSELGYRVYTDVVKQTHLFDFRMPEKHTADSDSPVVFSVDYGTLGEQSFVHSHEQYANMAYIMGGDIDNEEKLIRDLALATIGQQYKGYERFEIGINASDIKLEDVADQSDIEPYSWENNGETYFSSETEIAVIQQIAATRLKPRLIKRGEDELKNNYPEENTFTGAIVESDSLIYKQDWDLGDRVTCVYNRWGISADLTITEIQEEYSKTGRTITVTFGEGTPNFRKSLCALVRRTK